MKLKFLIPLFLGLLISVGAKAQDVAIKTNLLYDATATVNLGVEVGVAPKWTLDLSGNLNAWNVNEDKRWKHWLVQPEARYWFCDRFSRHFLGFHALGGQYNIGGLQNNIKFLGTDFSKLSNNRFQGWGVGAGVAYGYAMILGKHWNLEFEVGVGYIYSAYDIFECTGCGRRVGQDNNHYVGLTKAAINLVYLF
ncbi:MAG: DUF3575 domain-containing protein [Alistipes sp.]|jgi:hypothetical protein|nr:DUF3575 domain-containing protein [Alistipes sp.]MBQ5923898.1 DUF3575 domain-containing protein [Alistipes sp.]MBR5819103.1 DUF3575 domain-containing protein [Alistipes sp.]MEE1149120.1 DUF3575 domain-containing protein [Alistipes sp.]